MRSRQLMFLLAAVLVMFLAGCGANEDPTTKFCDALTVISETGPTIAALGEVADLAQIVQLGATMDNGWKDLSRAVEDMDEATQTAFAPYNEQYTSIPAITQETAAIVARSSLDAKNAIITNVYNEFYPTQCQ